ncbi:hypothetical protein OCU04_004156 [Sclerotinia nivalis]|uniref:Uncharacterized protein n=1 Tax=Sclerotinia nivalis TaxID=352851 RepID=A0A9X0DN80_9HELO|nr:hypothetical protein OCU04_004156 [Sclerotinia nivalis]
MVANTSSSVSASPKRVTLLGLLSHAIITPSLRYLEAASTPSPTAPIPPIRFCSLVTKPR